jgi:hypothetical protein
MIEEVKKFLFELINFKDSDAAKWKATALFSVAGTTLARWLIIVFAHEQPTRSAFAALRSKIGREDEEELVRVSLVEGTFKGNPTATL